MYYFSEYLRKTLDRILEYPLTIIEAVSGCGKSTAVHEYFLKQTAREYRQLSYTCLGGNPENIWKGICHEFIKIDGQVGQYLSSMPVPAQGMMGDIASQLRYLSCDEPTILCIDNFQMFGICGKERLIEALSLHTCERLHIIIITQPNHQDGKRFYTRFPFYCIFGESLYFTREDIGAYFLQEGIRLKKEEKDMLWDVTGGYVAAIQLQLDGWRYSGHFEVSARIPFLMEQVLWKPLREEERTCLLYLSVLKAFTLKQGAEICHGLMDKDEFHHFLENIDFIRLDANRGKYLFHHLLASFANEKFQEFPEDEKRKIWMRAAGAAAKSKEHTLAAMFYMKCQDYRSVVMLPFDKDDRVELVCMENGEIVKALIQPGCRELLRLNPELALSLTLELFVRGEMALFTLYLEAVKQLFENLQEYGRLRASNLRGEYCLMESFLAFNDVRKMCECHRQAWNYMHRETQLYSLNTAWTFGAPSVVCMFWSKGGSLMEEWEDVRDGLPLYYRLSGGNGKGAHHAMEGEIALLTGDDRHAKECYIEALYEAESMYQDSICYCAYLGMARLAVFRGNVATYTHMQENISDRPYLGREAACIFTTDVCKGYLAACLGQFSDVPDWLWKMEEIAGKALVPALPFVHSIYGRLLLEQMRRQTITYGKYEEGIHKLMEEARRFHMLLPEVYARIYLAAGAEMTGRQTEAAGELVQALQLCCIDQVLFPFAENYSLIQGILGRIVPAGNWKEMKTKITKLGEQFQKGKGEVLAALHVTDKVLTPREGEIAGLLKARLSVKEIAAKLNISPYTVSNTMQSIYSKLGIHSKRELYYREDI